MSYIRAWNGGQEDLSNKAVVLKVYHRCSIPSSLQPGRTVFSSSMQTELITRNFDTSRMSFEPINASIPPPRGRRLQTRARRDARVLFIGCTLVDNLYVSNECINKLNTFYSYSYMKKSGSEQLARAAI